MAEPGDPGRYRLGILLDGPGYGEAKTTRDRELGQIGVLEGLGWKIARVWTMDWWDNRRKEIDRLLTLLEQPAEPDQPAEPEEPAEFPELPALSAQPEQPQKLEAAALAEIPPRIRAIPDPVKPYRAAELKNRTLTAEEFTSYFMKDAVTKAVEAVMEAEAPVSRSLLTRRVLQSFGLSLSGPRIAESPNGSRILTDAGNTLTDEILTGGQ